jgi:hypothetical protein
VNGPALHGDPAKLLAFAERLVRDQGDELTEQNLALVLRVSRQTIRKWRCRPGEGVRLHVLDRIATEHGRHYSAFLPDDVIAALEATG